MSALTFDKNELGNLEYSLQREMLSTDRRGGYMSTTIVCCNTRRYHGLMVAPVGDGDRTCVLLSSLDETIIEQGQTFNLAIHRFRGVYEPRGHKYITDFRYTPAPTITYRVGGVILQKELLWIHKRTQLMIRYTLIDSPSEIRLRLRPFFAYRDKEALTHANMEANGRSCPVFNGVRNKLYEGYPWLYLQTNRPDAEFVAAPDWYYGFEYPQELERGYDGYEDLLTTGYFELPLQKGQSVIFSASVEEMRSTAEIEELFNHALSRRTHKIDFLSMLRHSARQFVVRRADGRTELLAGYPWLTSQIAREAFMALPGITLEQQHKEDCIEVLDCVCRTLRNGNFGGSASALQEADAPLWFFYTLQELETEIGSREIWKRYGTTMKAILDGYRKGFGNRVALHENGLIWAADDNIALSWMNSYVDGRPVTPRNGYQVETNALWYNAVCYTLALAKEAKDETFIEAWKSMPDRTRAAFLERFWLPEEGYLADYVNDAETNRFIRPNMIVACGLNYPMLDEEQLIDVLRTVNQHLLTPKGLRSLSPQNPLYNGTYAGDDRMRAHAAMNGTVWVWPLPFYVKACYTLYGPDFTPTVEQIIGNFDEDIQCHGIGSISKMYDADPPYTPKSAISYAWSVGAILQLYRLMERTGAVRNPKARTKEAENGTAGPAARKRSAGMRTTCSKGAAPSEKTTKAAKRSSEAETEAEASKTPKKSSAAAPSNAADGKSAKTTPAKKETAGKGKTEGKTVKK